jgi:hypothetical protein
VGSRRLEKGSLFPALSTPGFLLGLVYLQVVVCIVADGRKKIHPRVLDCLTLLGVYQPGDHMKNMVNNKEVTAHLFEYTTSFGLDPNLHFKYPEKGSIVPTQIIFCMKEKNQKKINSHRWFFNAFAPMLQVEDNACRLTDLLLIDFGNSRMFVYYWTLALDRVTTVSTVFGRLLMSIRASVVRVERFRPTKEKIGPFC